jgi:hypothetical protein
MSCHRDRARRRLRANPRRSGVEAGGVQHPLRKFECQSPSPPRAAGAPSQRSMLTSCLLCARTSGFCRNWETSRSDEAVTAASTMSPVVGERRGGSSGGTSLAHLPTAGAQDSRPRRFEKGAGTHARMGERVCVGGRKQGHCNYDMLDIAPCGSVAVVLVSNHGVRRVMRAARGGGQKSNRSEVVMHSSVETRLWCHHTGARSNLAATKRPL